MALPCQRVIVEFRGVGSGKGGMVMCVEERFQDGGQTADLGVASESSPASKFSFREPKRHILARNYVI